MLKYLTIEEIFITLIGKIGINAIYTPPPYPYLDRLEPDLFSAVDENIINPFTINGSFERDYDNRKIYIRLKDLILEPIKAGTIKSIDKIPKDKKLPLDFRVESESFWDWLRSETETRYVIISLLASLNREFPKAWQSIIDSGKTSASTRTKKKRDDKFTRADPDGKIQKAIKTLKDKGVSQYAVPYKPEILLAAKGKEDLIDRKKNYKKQVGIALSTVQSMARKIYHP